MRNPERVLSGLSSKSAELNYKYRDLYRNLYNPKFFLRAYAKISSNTGNMTSGTDGLTIDGMSMSRIEKLIQSLRDESYQPNPSERTYIPKKDGSKRPLGIPSVNDKLVQEVVRDILEAIYEGCFSNLSHGFRPNRSCHTALEKINTSFHATKWFVEGDIKGFFDNIDHHTLVKLLRKRIEDERFLRLVWKFLRAGYLENWTYHRTYSGTPQGGIISPILSNIYLHELDMYMEQYIEKFKKGKSRRGNPEYRKIAGRINYYRKRIRNLEEESNPDREKIISYKQIIKEHQKEYLKIPAMMQMDEEYRRMSYVRYADDFLVGVIGSKEDATQVKKDITEFISKELKLELSQEKTLITHASDDFAKFLGYEITITKSQDYAYNSKGNPVRKWNGHVYLQIPKDKWFGKLKEYNAISFKKGGEWFPTSRTYLIDYDELEILLQYNAEIKGLYEYFKMARNASVLNQFHYFMEYSLYKTFAHKYKSTVRKVINKYSVNKSFQVTYKTKNKTKTAKLYNGPFKRVERGTKESTIDNIPRTFMHSRNSLVKRLLAEVCEWCGQQNVPIEMHHVRKLKDLKGKKQWEKTMIARRRKTLALCTKCHEDLHAGRLD